MFSRLLQIREATLGKGHITVTDEARPDGVRTTQLETVEMALKVYPGKAEGDLHISAALPANGAPSSFSLTGTIGLSESSSTLAAKVAFRSACFSIRRRSRPRTFACGKPRLLRQFLRQEEPVSKAEFASHRGSPGTTWC